MLQVRRCGWAAGGDAEYQTYHDLEWGVPVHDDRTIFEFLVLEGFQAGLSWATVLRKRGNFRRSFDSFDYRKIARYDGRKVRQLTRDPGIIRNKLKIRATVTNARAFISVQEEFGSFDSYIWKFVGGKPKINSWSRLSEIPAMTPEAERLSADLIERGFKFVGPTICYAHMQATGMVNDHQVDCFRYSELGGRMPSRR